MLLKDVISEYDRMMRTGDFEAATALVRATLSDLAHDPALARLDVAACLSALRIPESPVADRCNRAHAHSDDRLDAPIAQRPQALFPMPSLGVDDVRWPGDPANMPDTWHLPPELANAPFTLNLDLVRKLIAVGQYLPDSRTNGKIILSLRGAMLEDPATAAEDQASIRLRALPPDHQSLRCLIGVVDLAKGCISLYPASTVPDRITMLAFHNKQNFGSAGIHCNLLPTGTYEMCVGTHGSPNGPISYILRLGNGPTPIDAYPVSVLRPLQDLVFTTSAVWETCLSADNLLPTFRAEGFSSSGCLMIEGSQRPHQSHETGTGAWRRFRQKLGIDGACYGARFDNLLTTGHEAATLARAKDIAPFLCLRHGSSGEQVAHLQNSLGLPEDGFFSARTREELARWQFRQLGFATGSWGATMAQRMSHALPAAGLH